jgi:sec-independent protein translocase protein TatB
VFGLSLGEIMLLLIVGIVVVGPKNLPTMMRTAGKWVSKLKQMSSDLRSQSGIDELIRHEGLEKEIQELRSLSRMNVMESLITPGALQASTRGASAVAALPAANAVHRPIESDRFEPLREREYPLIGCDAAGALADDAVIYQHEPAEPEAAEAAGDAPAEAVGAAERAEPEPGSSLPVDAAAPAAAPLLEQQGGPSP